MRKTYSYSIGVITATLLGCYVYAKTRGNIVLVTLAAIAGFFAAFFIVRFIENALYAAVGGVADKIVYGGDIHARRKLYGGHMFVLSVKADPETIKQNLTAELTKIVELWNSAGERAKFGAAAVKQIPPNHIKVNTDAFSFAFEIAPDNGRTTVRGFIAKSVEMSKLGAEHCDRLDSLRACAAKAMKRLDPASDETIQ